MVTPTQKIQIRIGFCQHTKSRRNENNFSASGMF